MKHNQHEIAKRIRSLLNETGRRHAKAAVIPDALFAEAYAAIGETCSILGIPRIDGDDIMLDGTTRLVGETEAGKRLAKYDAILRVIN